MLFCSLLFAESVLLWDYANKINDRDCPAERESGNGGCFTGIRRDRLYSAGTAERQLDQHTQYGHQPDSCASDTDSRSSGDKYGKPARYRHNANTNPDTNPDIDTFTDTNAESDHDANTDGKSVSNTIIGRKSQRDA